MTRCQWLLVATFLMPLFLCLTAKAEEPPLTLAVSTVGDFAKGYPWYLSMNSAGEAELTIDSPDGWVRRRFHIPNEDLAELRTVVADVRFFDLDDEYGELVFDGSTQMVTITIGQQSKSVKIAFLMNWVSAKDKEKLNEPSRAVRVLTLTRGWFTDPEAVDLRRYHQMVLNAVE